MLITLASFLIDIYFKGNNCRERRKKFLRVLNKMSPELNAKKIRKSEFRENLKSRTARRAKKFRVTVHLIEQKSCNLLPRLRKIPNS